jgi:3-hydroxyisobutyrate dehydrogenase-like beta-hydroxyacid dehydrogenase
VALIAPHYLDAPVMQRVQRLLAGDTRVLVSRLAAVLNRDLR